MLGFMMKDFLYFRRNTRLFALMVVLYLVFGFSMSNVAAISGMLSMLGLIVVLNCFTADEAAQYPLILPLREQVRAEILNWINKDEKDLSVPLSYTLLSNAVLLVEEGLGCAFCWTSNC